MNVSTSRVLFKRFLARATLSKRLFVIVRIVATMRASTKGKLACAVAIDVNATQASAKE